MEVKDHCDVTPDKIVFKEIVIHIIMKNHTSGSGRCRSWQEIEIQMNFSLTAFKNKLAKLEDAIAISKSETINH